MSNQDVKPGVGKYCIVKSEVTFFFSQAPNDFQITQLTNSHCLYSI